jgi:hypothetical protein
MTHVITWLSLLLGTIALIKSNAHRYNMLDRKNSHHDRDLFYFTGIDHHFKKSSAICLLVKDTHKENFGC